MIRRLKCMYSAGRSGQPMPARVDRSVGEAALQTGAVVGIFMITVFGLGRLGHVVDKATGYQDPEVTHTERKLELARTQLAIVRTKADAVQVADVTPDNK